MRAITLATIAFALGVIVSAAVTTLVPENLWKGFHWMFLFPAALLAEKLFGATFSSAHRVFTYGLGAILHGLTFALLFYLLTLFVPRLTRSRAVIALTITFIIDIVFLVLVWPMRELP